MLTATQVARVRSSASQHAGRIRGYDHAEVTQDLIVDSVFYLAGHDAATRTAICDSPQRLAGLQRKLMRGLIRQAQRNRKQSLTNDACEGRAHYVAPTLDQHELHAILREETATLPVEQLSMVTRWSRGESMAEIGASIGISKQAVQKRMAQAFLTLRTRLKRRGVDAFSAER